MIQTTSAVNVNLPQVNVMNDDGSMNDLAEFQADRFQAKAVVAVGKKSEFVKSGKRNYVGHSERTGKLACLRNGSSRWTNY